MKKSIKRIAEVLLTIILCCSFILLCGETENTTTQILWSSINLVVFASSAIILARMGVFASESEEDKI